MIHPHTELRCIGPDIGVGVFATKLIPCGTIVWVQDGLDQVLKPEFVDALDELRRAQVLKYGYRDPQGKWILCWDDGRFVNHSFHANCMGTAWDLEIATRDIPAGTELTDDYGTFNLEEPMDCLPESGTDRTQALPDDLLRYAAEWDRQVLDALHHYAQVPQPLQRYVRPACLRRLRASAAAGVLLDSIASTYFDARQQARADPLEDPAGGASLDTGTSKLIP
jgi:hypothetical protein